MSTGLCTEAGAVPHSQPISGACLIAVSARTSTGRRDTAARKTGETRGSSGPVRLSDPGFRTSSEDKERPQQGPGSRSSQRLGAGITENRAGIDGRRKLRLAGRRRPGADGRGRRTTPGSPADAEAGLPTRQARSNPDLARGRDQGFAQGRVPSLNSGVRFLGWGGREAAMTEGAPTPPVPGAPNINRPAAPSTMLRMVPLPASGEERKRRSSFLPIHGEVARTRSGRDGGGGADLDRPRRLKHQASHRPPPPLRRGGEDALNLSKRPPAA
ncbi:hypothetical protein ABIE19_000729 [Brevundimonas faecalis]|uniref:Uncharacterized protein n=1 Tax=Brevundimonas faecalis TaxID=947378 RepID=A0ABV2R8B5_9CAUL